MIVKVKEPLETEYPLLSEGKIVFTFFHFAASRSLTEAVVQSKCIAIAYEMIHDEAGRHPILAPMSEVAGKMSIQEGAKYLEKPMKGRGILLGGVPGVAPAKVVIIGGGTVGTNAAKVASGLGAQVTILDNNLYRLRYLDDIMPKNVLLLKSNPANIRKQICKADLVIGAVLVEGAKTPVLIKEKDLKAMQPGAVIVDVAIDQGGCFETSQPTTHSNPTYMVDGINHYCVANMPGAVGRTSTYALTNATMDYIIEIANKGYKNALVNNESIKAGVVIEKGIVRNNVVAETFGMDYQLFS